MTFAGPTGMLSLEQPSSFTGTVAGFGAQETIDLPSLAFHAHTTLGFIENRSDTGGTLSVKDKRHAATIALLGNYTAASFAIAADGHGGTLISEEASSHASLITAHKG